MKSPYPPRILERGVPLTREPRRLTTAWSIAELATRGTNKKDDKMTTIKRLNVNTFTSEADNDSFIAELSELWQTWSGPTSSSRITVDINKDRNNPARMTAFVTVESEEALEDALVDMNKWSLKFVVPIRSKYKHDNLMIDADLIASISK